MKLTLASYLDTIAIKQDTFGRYCLNDLHKASGGAKTHAPNEFFRLDGTKELVSELTGDSRFDPVQAVRGGSTPGTYVAKELVYAYAMWISPGQRGPVATMQGLQCVPLLFLQ